MSAFEASATELYAFRRVGAARGFDPTFAAMLASAPKKLEDEEEEEVTVAPERAKPRRDKGTKREGGKKKPTKVGKKINSPKKNKGSAKTMSIAKMQRIVDAEMAAVFGEAPRRPRDPAAAMVARNRQAAFDSAISQVPNEPGADGVDMRLAAMTGYRGGIGDATEARANAKAAAHFGGNAGAKFCTRFGGGTVQPVVDMGGMPPVGGTQFARGSTARVAAQLGIFDLQLSPEAADQAANLMAANREKMKQEGRIR